MFRFERYLEMHTKYKHASNHLLECSDCGKTFKYKGNLKRHKILQHKLNEDKYINIGNETSATFSCNTCKKKIWEEGFID